jgi:hypothetical protein
MRRAGRSAPSPEVLLGVSRIGLGVLFLVRTTGLAGLLSLSVFPLGRVLLGWPDGDGARLAPFFSLPSWAVAGACVARTVAAALFTLGLGTRPAGIAAGLLGYVVVAQDPLGFNMTLHTIYLGTIVLACTDAGSRYALRRAPARLPRAGLGMVRLWVASIYVWAGIAKLHGDWLSGRVLGTLVEGGIVRGPIAAAWLSTARGRAAAAPLVALGEIGLGLALVHRPTRRVALGAAVVLHVIFQAALAPDLFTGVMAALLVTFIGDIGPWREVFAVEPAAAEVRVQVGDA